MSQALSNLLANAVQHGAADSPVWVTVSRQEADVVMVVQNESEAFRGAGCAACSIPPRALP